MKKISTRRPRLQPLADGQEWRMPNAILRVRSVGRLLVHYKMTKPNASLCVASSSCTSIKAIEELLKANRAMLV
jgi:hypothetical protein